MAGLFHSGMSTREAWARDARGLTWLSRTIGEYRDDVTRQEINVALDHDRITRKGVAEFWRGWDAAGPQKPNAEMGHIKQLQQQLAEIELRFEPLRKNRLQDSPEWGEIAEAARQVRAQLWGLTGDAYGKPKAVKPPRPDNDLLCARYDAPEDVPAEVLEWLRKHAPLITSDATDAVRWSRIIDTQRDERYPEGKVTLYRAVDRGSDIVDEIRAGDWVTDSLEYARDHLARWLDGKGTILKMEVDGRDVLVSPTGNMEEAIYAPMDLSGPIERSPVVRECEK